LSPFSHPDLIDAFSGGESEGEADLTALLDGAIYFVSLPMTLVRQGRGTVRLHAHQAALHVA
jgi:hypothetical protein